MEFKFNEKKDPKAKGKKGKKEPKFLSSIATAILIFMLITAVYLALSSSKPLPEVSISDLAKSVSNGEVSKIDVATDDLTITYKDNSVKKAKKETESSLSQTLFNYGVKPDALNATQITVKSDTGFMYWLVNILPFLLPIIFIIFFFWYLSRQVKGAGMQAFTFGQSKARITDPNDKTIR